MDNVNTGKQLLVLNAGSSSVKMALYSIANERIVLQIGAQVSGIGLQRSTITITHASAPSINGTIVSDTHQQATTQLIESLRHFIRHDALLAIGHRVVFGGMNLRESRIINATVIEELNSYCVLDPDHLPYMLDVYSVVKDHFNSIPHVACFDTAFFRDLPDIVKFLPIPRKYASKGIIRYGYHGLSYESLLTKLQDKGVQLQGKKIILAHLGSGASVTAVKNGAPIDTTMSFAPSSGIPMSTRSGDIDPSVVVQLLKHEGISSDQLVSITNKKSGLLGVSNLSGDMLTLLKNESTSQSAYQAVAMFCYNIKKTIGSYAAALGGIDMLAFSGGIGEKSPIIRKRICSELGFLHVNLDQAKNESNETLISRPDSIPIYALHTDEEQIIATKTLDIVIKQNKPRSTE
jgi:acetate kinase